MNVTIGQSCHTMTDYVDIFCLCPELVGLQGQGTCRSFPGGGDLRQ